MQLNDHPLFADQWPTSLARSNVNVATRVHEAAKDAWTIGRWFAREHSAAALPAIALRSAFAASSAMYTAGWSAIAYCPPQHYFLWMALPAGRFRIPTWRCGRLLGVPRWRMASCAQERWARLLSHYLLLRDHQARLELAVRTGARSPLSLVAPKCQTRRCYQFVGGGRPDDRAAEFSC